MQKETKNSRMDAADSAISYAMYFIAIITTLILFVFLKFNADLYVIEETLENGLHIAESRALTANQDGLNDDGKRTDVYEREMSRMHIITKFDNSGINISAEEQGQAAMFGQTFSDALRAQLNLDQTHPNGSILRSMCGPDADILINTLVIYEPVYSRTVEKEETGAIITSSPESFLPIYQFNTNYQVENWIVYTLFFNENNDYINLSKSIIPASDTPVLLNGNEVEGATIEATISTQFNGIRNIFAGIGGSSSESSGFFSANPMQTRYAVEVTQSVDIVVAGQDSRKQP